MTNMLVTKIGRVELKNPLIAGAAEHLIEADGVRRALRTGVAAVVVKSTNESQGARDLRIEYPMPPRLITLEWGPNQKRQRKTWREMPTRRRPSKIVSTAF